MSKQSFIIKRPILIFAIAIALFFAVKPSEAQTLTYCPLSGDAVTNTCTWTATSDFSNVPLLKARVSSALTTSVIGDLGCDSTALNCHLHNGSADNVIALIPTASLPSNNQIAQFKVSAGQLTLAGISLPFTAAQGGTGSSSVPSAGQVPVGNAGGTAYAPVTVSGDCTMASTGAITCPKINGGTVPVSTLLLATDGSSRPIAGTAHGVGNAVFCSANSGSTTVYACTVSPSVTPADGDLIDFDADVTNTGPITLNVNGSGAVAVQKWTGCSGTPPCNLIAGDVQANQPTLVYFDAGLNIWSEMSPMSKTSINGALFPTSATVVGSNGSAQPVAATTTGSGTTVVLATSPSLTTPSMSSPTVTGTASGSSTFPIGMLVPGTNGQCGITSAGAATWGSCAGTAGVQLIGSPNTTTVTVSTSTTSVQTLQSGCASTPCYSAGVLNSLNKTVDFEVWGGFSSVNTTETISLIFGFTSSNTLTLASFVPTSTAQGQWHIHIVCVVSATGATGQLVCGPDGGISDGAGKAFIIPNVVLSNPTLTNVDLTSALSPTAFISFTTASTSNIGFSYRAVTHQHN